MTILKLSIVYLLLFINLNHKGLYYEFQNVHNRAVMYELMKLNLKAYTGKEVKYLLETHKLPKYSSYVFIDEKPGLLSCLSLAYANGLSVDIYVSKYRFTKQFDTRRKWQLSTFKEETISRIEIVNDGEVVESYK